MVEPVARIGDRNDPAYTVRILRQRLRQTPLLQAVMTAQPDLRGVWRHGWVLIPAQGDVCWLVAEAFASGYGGLGADALALAVRTLARQRVRLRWYQGFPDEALLTAGAAGMGPWAAAAHPLWVRRVSGETAGVRFDPDESLLTIDEPPAGRRLAGDEGQLSLFAGA